MDPNGNGYLSLAEVDRGMKIVLKCETLFNVKPVLIRAFNAAKDVSGTQTGPDADYLVYSEFRTFLVYLRQYFEYWVMFDRIDSSDDRRIDFKEFNVALAEIRKWGVEVTDKKSVWAELDADGVGYVLLYMYVNSYVMLSEYDMRTSWTWSSSKSDQCFLMSCVPWKCCLPLIS